MPDRYAVIGNPVAHSKSPLIHAEFARETGQDMSYDMIHAGIAEFEAEVERFQAAGGRGLNVTLPFKHRAYALARKRTLRAEEARAVNTLVLGADGIAGDNTDGAGLTRDLVHNVGCGLRGRRVLLMGAGGASYGACGALLAHGPARLVVANRTVDKALALCAHFQAHANAAALAASSYPELAGNQFDVVINATSAGLAGEMPALPPGVFAPGATGYEMVYGRKTPFMAFAETCGALVADGLGMLVEQAAESFHLWRGVRPDTRPVIALLRR